MHEHLRLRLSLDVDCNCVFSRVVRIMLKLQAEHLSSESRFGKGPLFKKNDATAAGEERLGRCCMTKTKILVRVFQL